MTPAHRRLAAGLAVLAASAIACTSRVGPASATRRESPSPLPPVPSATPSPTPPSATVTPGAHPTVVIDPGHNGQNWAHTAEINRVITVPTGHKPCDTTGTTSLTGYTESAYNLDVALRVAPILTGQGDRVLLTRTNDSGWGPCIDQRVALAYQAAADAVVSIHADGWPTGRGFYVLYAAPAGQEGATDPLAANGRRLAVDVRDAFAKDTGVPYSTYGGHDGLMTVPWPTLYHVPEVLIETVNMRSATDSALAADASFRDRVARSIADGIAAYLAGR